MQRGQLLPHCLVILQLAPCQATQLALTRGEPFHEWLLAFLPRQDRDIPDVGETELLPLLDPPAHPDLHAPLGFVSLEPGTDNIWGAGVVDSGYGWVEAGGGDTKFFMTTQRNGICKEDADHSLLYPICGGQLYSKVLDRALTRVVEFQHKLLVLF